MSRSPVFAVDFSAALHVTYLIVIIELLVIVFIRCKFMNSRLQTAIIQAIIGGGIIFAIEYFLSQPE